MNHPRLQSSNPRWDRGNFHECVMELIPAFCRAGERQLDDPLCGDCGLGRERLQLGRLIPVVDEVSESDVPLFISGGPPCATGRVSLSEPARPVFPFANISLERNLNAGEKGILFAAICHIFPEKENTLFYLGTKQILSTERNARSNRNDTDHVLNITIAADQETEKKRNGGQGGREDEVEQINGHH
jgi:hypothetical protein